ncbi:MAG: hypothetical protein OXI43_23145 [Candidatus Poribacteria bacterium]|nr:hypothetical protein [Candidatus Poribacteria bacterium]
MKRLLHTFVWVLSVSFLLSFSLSTAFGQGEGKEDLIGHWTFEKGDELKDLTGHFGDIELKGAQVKDGQLHLGDNKWALTTGYKGPDIGPDKTLVTWLYLDDLNIRRGATIAVNKSSSDMFDAIVYAERHEKHWMAGSSFFRRTPNVAYGPAETETGKLIQLAISYEDDGGNAKIMIYRNGEIIGDYTQGPIRTWVEGDVEALFGPRALIGGTAHGWIVARVEDARIYNTVLSEDEINNLTENILDVKANGKLATTWGAIKNK